MQHEAIGDFWTCDMTAAGACDPRFPGADHHKSTGFRFAVRPGIRHGLTHAVKLSLQREETIRRNTQPQAGA
jgi:hypothetical protein